MRAVREAPLFAPVDRYGYPVERQLTTETIRQIIVRRSAAVGVTERISGHSLRVGGAQHLQKLGVTMPQLLRAGRWRSEAQAMNYVANLAAEDQIAARLFK